MKPKPVEDRVMKQTDGCGLFGIYPKCLRSYATSRTFVLVYGLLGMVQAMSFIYIVVTLTTLEKRFKIPSRTTGIILSGNEISQILSLILMYYGGAGHRPRWLATGVGFSAASCFVLALPHLIYGPGRDAKALTQEYLDSSMLNSTTLADDLSLCLGGSGEGHCNEADLEDSSMIPRLLIFLSQFILGVGTTLYFGLGQTYLDDNTKKKNTPVVLGCTFSLRTLGPAIGFILGYTCLNMYIDPSLHPVIDQKDPRWLGAWWLGWLILGTLLSVFTFLIAMFPRELLPPVPKKSKKSKRDQESGEEPLKLDINFRSSVTKEPKVPEVSKVPKVVQIEKETTPVLSDFPKTLKRILSNKILMCNCISAMCTLFGFSPYMTFLTKYLEVQFSISAAGGSVMTGTVSLIGMVGGFLISGFVISKFRPGAGKLLGWNVVVALFYAFVIVSYAYVTCEGPQIQGVDLEHSSINFTTACNNQCNCGGVKFSPVCHEASMTTFFSACHAGCTTVIDGKDYGNCTCVPDPTNPSDYDDPTKDLDFVKAGPCQSDCTKAYFIYAILSTIAHIFMSSARIGNVLVNYRCVATKDKSFAQGVTLMMLSLFALIPAPIFFGALIDSTCLIWDESCGTQGNCWYYDKERFRYIINFTAAGFILAAAILDGVVGYLARDLDLYGVNDDQRIEFVKDLMPSAESTQIEANGTPGAVVPKTEKSNISESIRL